MFHVGFQSFQYGKIIMIVKVVDINNFVLVFYIFIFIPRVVKCSR